jgi:hypothetical protein
MVHGGGPALASVLAKRTANILHTACHSLKPQRGLGRNSLHPMRFGRSISCHDNCGCWTTIPASAKNLWSASELLNIFLGALQNAAAALRFCSAILSHALRRASSRARRNRSRKCNRERPALTTRSATATCRHPGMEGYRMLPLIVCAGVLWADLARPFSPEEYRRVIGQQVLRHEPLPAAIRAYYRAKRRVLACFLHKGMTTGEVREVLGHQPSGWVCDSGACTMPTYRTARAGTPMIFQTGRPIVASVVIGRGALGSPGHRGRADSVEASPSSVSSSPRARPVRPQAERPRPEVPNSVPIPCERLSTIPPRIGGDSAGLPVQALPRLGRLRCLLALELAHPEWPKSRWSPHERILLKPRRVSTGPHPPRPSTRPRRNSRPLAGGTGRLRTTG